MCFVVLSPPQSKILATPMVLSTSLSPQSQVVLNFSIKPISSNIFLEPHFKAVNQIVLVAPLKTRLHRMRSEGWQTSRVVAVSHAQIGQLLINSFVEEFANIAKLKSLQNRTRSLKPVASFCMLLMTSYFGCFASLCIASRPV